MHHILICLLAVIFLCNSVSTLYSADLSGFPLIDQRKQSIGSQHYFINPIMGNDTNSGLDLQHAWKSMSPINSIKLSAGDIINLAPGEYRQSLVITGEGTFADPIAVRFEAGEYDFYPDNSFKQKLHITNTNDDPDGSKCIAIAFIQARHVRVTAEKNTDLYMHGKMMHVLIDHVEDIEISDLNFDFRRPTMSEFTVAEVGKKYAILTIHKDSTYKIENNRLIWFGEGWGYVAPGFCQQGIPEEGTLWRSRNPLVDAKKVEELSPGIVKAYYENHPEFIKGRLFQDRQTKRDCAGVFARNSNEIRWRNCNFYYMHGMGLVNQFVENLKLDHVNFSPRSNSGRTGSCWADAVQVMGCRGDFIADSCTFSGLHDDPINVHGTYLRIIQRVSDRQIRVRFMHPQTYGFEAFFAGDDVGFVRGDSVQTFGKGRVKHAVLENDKEMLVTMEADMPTDIKMEDVLENITWAPTVTIRNCLISMDSCRGLLLTTPRKITVENNTFHNTYMHAILIEGNASGWYESGPVRDVLIRGNTFLTTSQACIEISPGNRKNEGPVHQNIRIEGNFFKLNKNAAVNANSVKGLQIIKNRFSSDSIPISHRDCQDVTILNNVLNAAE